MDMVFGRDLVSETGAHADVAQNVRTSLKRIAETDTAVEAFEDEPDRESRLARTSTESSGPLRGATLGVKDIFAVENLPTRGGSALDPGEFAGPEASAVTLLRRAGATVIGKTKTAEFACVHPPTTHNPHDLRHTPGGSSSGSAAAVATGAVALAVGTQTIGSVIRPASYCGVAGFKTTQGSVSLDGVIPCAQSYDSFGLFATSVSGLVLGASVFFEEEQSMGRKPVVAVPAREYLALATETTNEVFGTAVRELAESGLDFVHTDLAADVAVLTRTQSVIFDCEFARAHEDRFRRHAHVLGAGTVAAIQRGLAISERDYAAAVGQLAEQRAAFDTRMDQEGIDLVVAPAATDVAPLGLSSTGSPVMSLPWSHLGLPCVTFPLPRGAGELPLGLQLVGRRHADLRLLGWAGEVAATIAELTDRQPGSSPRL
ncbi:amidase family protein [Streptomyces xylophagus]|uniref:amidase family protein n=1 Tax=Streptomyces xylophagus TaxID=285514 RepID=UPI0005BE7295|nr:amidase [Streptomyces xylophagus]